MKKMIFAISALATTTAVWGAQDAGRLPGPLGGLAEKEQAQHRAALQTNERGITILEQSQARMEATKEDVARDNLAVAYEQQQQEYANTMLRDHDRVVGQMRRIGQPIDLPKHAVAIAQLNDYEVLAQAHEKRMGTLSAKAQMIAAGRQTSALKPVIQAPSQSNSVFAAIHEFLFPSAQAAIALTVYNACKKDSSGNVNQAACAAATTKALADSAAAKNTFDSCWASHENVKPKWVRALRRAACTAALVVRLA